MQWGLYYKCLEWMYSEKCLYIYTHEYFWITCSGEWIHTIEHYLHITYNQHETVLPIYRKFVCFIGVKKNTYHNLSTKSNSRSRYPIALWESLNRVSIGNFIDTWILYNWADKKHKWYRNTAPHIMNESKGIAMPWPDHESVDQLFQAG